MVNIKDKLTIVIPCKNEGFNLVNTINSLNFDGKIIIADSSTDNTLEILKNNYTKNNLLVINGGLPAIARNNGAKHVNTEYVLFIDSDIFINDSNLLNTAINKIDMGYDLITCRINTHDNFIYKLSYYIFDLIQIFTSISKPFAVGGFMLFRLNKFIELGGFDESDKFAEDYHLSSKIKPKKFKILNKTVYTSSRRLKNKGLFYMSKMMLKSWFNRNNDNFFKQDYGYWD
jgi:glycosyltransferase involved in cell wall biosynthesis